MDIDFPGGLDAAVAHALRYGFERGVEVVEHRAVGVAQLVQAQRWVAGGFGEISDEPLVVAFGEVFRITTVGLAISHDTWRFLLYG